MCFGSSSKIIPEGFCLEITFYCKTHRKIIEEMYKHAIKNRKGYLHNPVSSRNLKEKYITIFYFSGGYESQRFITSLKQVSDGLPETPSFHINYPYISI